MNVVQCCRLSLRNRTALQRERAKMSNIVERARDLPGARQGVTVADAWSRGEGGPRSAGGQDSPAGYDWYAPRRPRAWRPPTDVYETDSHVVIKVEIAGLQENDFDLSFRDGLLIVGGVRRDPVGKLIYQNMEIRYGEFRTEVRIEWSLNQAQIEATYEGGFLYVKVPKAREYRVPVHALTTSET